MAANGSADIVLKILSGVQSGVDIVLAEGEYALGSGDDDDIQLFDVGLSPAHMRIAIRQGKIEVAGGAGSLRTGNGIALDAGTDFQEIEPLDIVTAGASRFALGPMTANWTSIVDVGGLSQPFPAAPPRSNRFDSLARVVALTDRRTVLPVAIVLLLAVAIFAVSYRFSIHQQPETQESVKTDLELVDASLRKLAFSNRLSSRKEIDGIVFVTGYVTTPVERRAVLAAIRDTGVPAKIRISVTELIRNEISNFLDSEGTNLSFDLSETGDLTLTGTMLDADRHDQLTETIRERIIGIASITSQVRTGPSLLRDVQALAERAQILPLVLLRRDGELIEASGVIPIDKIDAWAGFLQAYSTQLAPIIALRSLVVLQDPSQPQGVVDGGGKALLLGSTEAQGDDLNVDVSRLRAGSFDLSDIFVGQPNQARADGLSVPMARNPASDPAVGFTRPGASSSNGIIDLATILGGNNGNLQPELHPVREVRVIDLDAGAGSGGIQATDLPALGGAPRVADSRAVGGQEFTGTPPSHGPVTTMAQRLIENWGKGTLDDKVNGVAPLMKGMQTLANERLDDRSDDPASVPAHYDRMLASLRGRPSDGQSCWKGSRLTFDDALATLFFLDLLSVSNELSLTWFDVHFQELMLEAALNPEMTSRCVEQKSGTPPPSVYLREVQKNPAFVRHVLRDTTSFSLDVTGASLTGDRYVQTRKGLKLKQGAAPDERSRILTVGELGMAFEQPSGYASLIFDDTLNWLTQ
ncbi:type III secretion system inner membrane ring subunit SctD [Mesorhizobium sp. ANAO-SY3R2]|uniref:type III secretion system inner membrane ring subunit SctD n=1 Tax=Mesorhizobium sp. ANAO-SY3R2 TaxID=3166644 RepID=UPI003672BF6A